MAKRKVDMHKQLSMNIAYYRKKAEISQLDLAEVVGVSRTHISRIEATGMTASLSLDTLFAIAEALDVEVAKLFEIR